MKDRDNFFGEPCHDILTKSIKPSLSYSAECDFSRWRDELSDKLYTLTGLYDIEKNKSPNLNLEILWQREKDGYTEIKFTFSSEIGATVPCYLLIPKGEKEKYPVAITLQGHSTGAHNSAGYLLFDRDKEYQPRGQFGIQAVRNGYAALCIEQRGMGERRPTAPSRLESLCGFTALSALQLGRTVLGERMYDISCAIDVLDNFKECDTEKIFITGNSGGGTASYYAACIDKRIKLCVPSCAFCSYSASILDIAHCCCNYIPSAFKYFEMQDLASLIAPRPIAVIAGEHDDIFPIEGVKSAYATLSEIYKAAGAEDECRLVVTPKDHWWCVDIVWDTVNDMTRKLGWI